MNIAFYTTKRRPLTRHLFTPNDLKKISFTSKKRKRTTVLLNRFQIMESMEDVPIPDESVASPPPSHIAPSKEKKRYNKKHNKRRKKAVPKWNPFKFFEKKKPEMTDEEAELNLLVNIDGYYDYMEPEDVNVEYIKRSSNIALPLALAVLGLLLAIIYFINQVFNLFN